MRTVSQRVGNLPVQLEPSPNLGPNSDHSRGGQTVANDRFGNWARLTVRWRASAEFLTPIRVEAKTGFHCGKMSAKSHAAAFGLAKAGAL